MRSPPLTKLDATIQLIDQIFLEADVTSQQVRYESFGKLRFVAEQAPDGVFVEPHDDTLGHGRYRRQAERLACQAFLAKEVPLSVERNDRFLA